jgi:hypothetical protein
VLSNARAAAADNNAFAPAGKSSPGERNSVRCVLFAHSGVCFVCAPVAENWMILMRRRDVHDCCNLWPGKIEWPPPTREVTSNQVRVLALADTRVESLTLA